MDQPIKQKGMSIVELMVAILLGMLITLGVIQTYLSGLSTQRAQTDVTRLNETVRLSFELVARELRKAGYRNTWEATSTATDFCNTPAMATTPINHIQGLNDPDSIDPNVPSLVGTSVAIANKSDVLRVRYYGESDNSVLDCHGFPVAQGQLVEDTLYVASDPNNNNEPTIFCNTDNPTPVKPNHPGSVPLVAGVESLQLLYGEDADQNDDNTIISRYVPWGIDSAFNPDHIMSVKTSIVARSLTDTDSDPNPSDKVFKHFSVNGFDYPFADNIDTGANFTASTDLRRIRTMLATEVALRNFGYCGTM